MEKEFVIYWVPRFQLWVHDDGLRISQAYIEDNANEDVLEIIYQFTGHRLPQWVLDEMKQAPDAIESESDTELVYLYTEE